MDILFVVVGFVVFGSVVVGCTAAMVAGAHRRAESAEAMLSQTQQQVKDIMDRTFECLDMAIESKKVEAARTSEKPKSRRQPPARHHAFNNGTDALMSNGTPSPFDISGALSPGNDPIGS